MRAVLVGAIGLLGCAAACGDDGGGSMPPMQMDDELEDGSTGDGSGDGSDAPETMCRTENVTNAIAGEKLNAAFCFGMAYDGAYGCEFVPADNAVYCPAENAAGYYVVFEGDDWGQVYDGSNDSPIATVEQSTTGEFIIRWLDAEGECTVIGDVATLCVTLAG